MKTLAGIVVLIPIVCAQPQDARARVDKIFEKYNRTDSPGCAVAASVNGSTVLSAGYGMADLEHNVPITPETIFEAGSVSKQFTAAAVLLLAQQGKLSLDDPIRKYIPEVPDYGKPVTIRHLLNHTSGLRDWGSVEAIAGWPRTTRVYTHANVLEIISRQHALNYEPGADYSYTNSGFNLLAILVAKLSGRSFSDFERDSIFNPLDMSSTQWRDDYQRIVKNRAIAYEVTDGETRMLMPFENIYGNGGLLTTVGDLLRWNQNFTSRKVGGDAMFNAQHQQGVLNNGNTIAYAAGLMVLHWNGVDEVSHSGSTAGYRAWLARYPKQGLSVAVLCNTASANPGQHGHDVAHLYLASAESHPKGRGIAADAATLASEAGLYRSMRDHEALQVAVKNGYLMIGRRLAVPISADVFQFQLGENEPNAQFERDASGKVVRLKMPSEIGESNDYEKVEPWSPSQAELRTMAGEYRNDEAETTFTVTVEPSGLVMHRRPDARIALTPTYEDGFSSSLGSVRFLHDASGRVNELSIGEGRVWDMRFARVR